MRLGSGLERLRGFPFEVRYSAGVLERAHASAEVMGEAYDFLHDLFAQARPDIALIVALKEDWRSRQPYGLPFFNDDDDQIRPGIIVMPASRGDFWRDMGQELCEASPDDCATLVGAYPDGAGGFDLQPFFDLITIHELGHAFEVLGGLSLPTFWLGEIFANLCLHAFVATRRRAALQTLEVLSIVGSRSARLDVRYRSEGYSTLEELETHYTGGANPMGPLNYVWYQYRWQRIAAGMFDAEGEEGVVRFWNFFRDADNAVLREMSPENLALLLRTRVSETLGRAVEQWPLIVI